MRVAGALPIRLRFERTASALIQNDGIMERAPCGEGTAVGCTLAAAEDLLIEPDVFHTPTVVGAVVHDCQPPAPGLLAGRAARIKDDRAHRRLCQQPLDVQDELFAFLRIGFGRLFIHELIDLGVAIA